MSRTSRGRVLGAIAGLFLLSSPLAHADEEKVMTNAHPASAASAPTATRTLKFRADRAIPATLTLKGDKPIPSGWQAQFRFAGQTNFHECKFNLPKVGQQVQPGTPTVGTIVCSSPWQLYDNGLAFEAFQDDRKVAEGTIRP